MLRLIRIFTAVFVVCSLLSSAGAVQADETSDDALNKDPKPDAFMTHWLTCGAFPVSIKARQPVGEDDRKQAFIRDYLTEQGGEARIHPTPGLTHRRAGREYKWQSIASKTEDVDLVDIYGPKEDVIAYAWAEIEMSADKTVLLSIGSDDAVKVWLNGKTIHESWIHRGLSPRSVCVNRTRHRKNGIKAFQGGQVHGWQWLLLNMPPLQLMVVEVLLNRVHNGPLYPLLLHVLRTIPHVPVVLKEAQLGAVIGLRAPVVRAIKIIDAPSIEIIDGKSVS
jgi:hypothetical protein